MTTVLSDAGVQFADGSVQARATFPVTVRQTILSGAAAFIAIGSGLSCNLLATTTPLRLAFAQGFDASGQVDFISTLSADVAGYWPGLTANVNNYLFVDRNTSTGVLTAISSILPYIAQDASVAISVANGQHTYVYDTGQMYVGNGATATAVQRVAVGECLAGAATITSVVSYAKLRKFQSQTATGTIPTPTRINANHNIGVKPRIVRCTMINISAEGGYTAGQEMEIQGLSSAANTNVVTFGADNSLSMGVTASNTAIYIWHRTAGTIFAFTAGNWATRFYAEGGF